MLFQQDGLLIIQILSCHAYMTGKVCQSVYDFDEIMTVGTSINIYFGDNNVPATYAKQLSLIARALVSVENSRVKASSVGRA